MCHIMCHVYKLAYTAVRPKGCGFVAMEPLNVSCVAAKRTP